MRDMAARDCGIDMRGVMRGGDWMQALGFDVARWNTRMKTTNGRSAVGVQAQLRLSYGL